MKPIHSLIISNYLGQLRPLGTWLVLALLSGCTALSSDSGLTEVRRISKREDGSVLIYKHTGDDANSIASQTGALLGKRLDPDAAVTIGQRRSCGQTGAEIIAQSGSSAWR
jgi:hypothetical protein